MNDEFILNYTGEELNEKLEMVGYLSTAYVTPEMYGAIGDGVTDDTDAIQSAMDTGCPVDFDKNKQYFVSGFTIRNNIKLNGNGATLLCTGKTPVDSSSKYCPAYGK